MRGSGSKTSGKVTWYSTIVIDYWVDFLFTFALVPVFVPPSVPLPSWPPSSWHSSQRSWCTLPQLFVGVHKEETELNIWYIHSQGLPQVNSALSPGPCWALCTAGNSVSCTTSDRKLDRGLETRLMLCYITCWNFGLKLLSLAVHFHENLLILKLFWREGRARIKSPSVGLSTYIPTFLQLFQTAEYHIHLNALHCFSKHLPVPANFIWNWACAELYYRPSKHVVFLSVPVLLLRLAHRCSSWISRPIHSLSSW